MVHFDPLKVLPLEVLSITVRGKIVARRLLLGWADWIRPETDFTYVAQAKNRAYYTQYH